MEEIMYNVVKHRMFDKGIGMIIQEKPGIELLNFKDDGVIPNSVFPLIMYRQAIDFGENSEEEAEKEIKEAVAGNGWYYSWTWEIYDFTHYHSTAHELLIIYKGGAIVELGGETKEIGRRVEIRAGDAFVIPAGVAHKRITKSADFTVFGCYPKGQEYDMNYGKKEERKYTLYNIKNLALPKSDPFYGGRGPLMKEWEVEQA